ncbi:MAG TPA: TIGR03086 family metal-binding protein, partial [Acidimicrobiales bacterium]
MALEPFETLDRATAEFEKRLRLVSAEQWSQPTPCEGWTVTDLVRHVVNADVMAVVVLHGGSREDAVTAMSTDALGDDPVGAYCTRRDAMVAAFREDGALERTCAHPVGDIPGAQLMGFRVADHTMHAWDLARAIGADETLDAELVETVWEALEPLIPFIGSLGM